MACRSKRGGLNRSTPTRPKQSAQEKAATTSFTASAYWKFESSPLQRRVEQTLRGAHRHRAGLAPGWDEITKGAGKDFPSASTAGLADNPCRVFVLFRQSRPEFGRNARGCLPLSRCPAVWAVLQVSLCSKPRSNTPGEVTTR